MIPSGISTNALFSNFAILHSLALYCIVLVFKLPCDLSATTFRFNHMY